MQIVARSPEHHLTLTFLSIFITGLGIFFSIVLVNIYLQSFFTAKTSEVSAPAYNPPPMTMNGNIISNLDGGKGYAIKGLSQNGVVTEAVAFYPDGRAVQMSGKVQVSGRFIDNDCKYKDLFGGDCVPYIEISQIKQVAK